MKNPAYYLLFVLLVACQAAKWPSESFIQSRNYQEVINQTENQENKPDKYAMYPNGKRGISFLIVKNLTYPPEARVNGITGQVIVKYVVEKDGYIKKIDVIQSAHPALDKEAIRLIQLMSRWIPAYKNGQPIEMEYQQPFTFKVAS